MNDRFKYASFTLILGTAAVVNGCKSYQGPFGIDRCADIPAGAIPAKAGTQVCQWQQAQVEAASTDLGVFYQADFIGTSNELGPAGKKHVDRLVQQGLVGQMPIILDPSSDAERDTSRQQALAMAFTQAGAPLSADQILLAYPPAIGLSSFRAEQAVRSLSRGGGGGGGGGAGAAGGFGGAGGGGGFGGTGGGFGGGGMF